MAQTEMMTPEKLSLRPDRDKLLMSKELEGLVPGLSDDAGLDTADIVEDDHRPMVSIERQLHRDGVDPTDEHVIGRLLQLSNSQGKLDLGLRLDCSDALAVIADVDTPGTTYTGIQIHYRDDHVVKIPAHGCCTLVSASIDELTTAGTCTLAVTLRCR